MYLALLQPVSKVKPEVSDEKSRAQASKSDIRQKRLGKILKNLILWLITRTSEHRLARLQQRSPTCFTVRLLCLSVFELFLMFLLKILEGLKLDRSQGLSILEETSAALSRSRSVQRVALLLILLPAATAHRIYHHDFQRTWSKLNGTWNFHVNASFSFDVSLGLNFHFQWFYNSKTSKESPSCRSTSSSTSSDTSGGDWFWW